MSDTREPRVAGPGDGCASPATSHGPGRRGEEDSATTPRSASCKDHAHDDTSLGAVETVPREAAEHLADNIVDLLEGPAAVVRDQIAVVTPKLRGWLHFAGAPLAAIAGLVLVLVSATTASRIGAGVFVGTAAVQFAISAAYNIGRYGPRTTLLLRRADHSTIFLLIAGSCTPFALVLLEGQARTTLLVLIWGGAAAGIAFKVLFPHTHRLISVLPYIGLGWVAVFFLPHFADTASTVTLLLFITGGLLYLAGVVVYGLRRPNPSMAWFGFHELFHAATLLAFIAHFIAVGIAVT